MQDRLKFNGAEDHFMAEPQKQADEFAINHSTSSQLKQAFIHMFLCILHGFPQNKEMANLHSSSKWQFSD
jgi:hypothetical protein